MKLGALVNFAWPISLVLQWRLRNMNETWAAKTESFSSWHVTIEYVFVSTIVNASAPWTVKVAANSTPVTSEGYELLYKHHNYLEQLSGLLNYAKTEV